MDNPGRVASWLEGVETDGISEDMIEVGEKQEEKLVPITPPRQLLQLKLFDKTSPTDSSFSPRSIFDSGQRLRLPDQGDDGLENASDSTSMDGEELKSDKKVATVRSYDPPFELKGHFDAAQRPLAPHDPSARRIVWLTSCLQCTLANLPCSRTIPTCSRCKRNGYAPICLLQRRLFADDIEDSPAARLGLPVLLRLKIDDGDAWEKKVELAEKLLGTWQEEQDKKNWVLPSVNTVRGNYSVAASYARKVHPGEGPRDSKEAVMYVAVELHLE